MPATLTTINQPNTAPPPTLLAIETSTHVLSVGLLSPALPGQVLLTQGEGGAQASAHLVPTVMRLLAQAGLTLADLDAVVYGCGPGAFTGLRTATAVVQGLAYGTRSAKHPNGLPVLGIDTLLVTAEAARRQLQTNATSSAALPTTPCVITAMLDARMDEMYAATWEFDDPAIPHARLLAGPWLVKPDVLAPLLPEQATRGWLAGNVFEVYDSRLPDLQVNHTDGPASSQPLQSIRHISCGPDAAALLRLAPNLLNAGQATLPVGAQPVYVRDHVAKTTLERAAEQAAAARAKALHTRTAPTP